MLSRTLMDPPALRGTIVPFPRATVPVGQFNTEAWGCVPPAGQAIRFPSPVGETMVNWKDTASAPVGIVPAAHPFGGAGRVAGEPDIWKFRVVLAGTIGGPAWPEKPCPVRVSAIRQGATPTKGRGAVTSVIGEIPPPRAEGDHVAGSDQFGMLSEGGTWARRTPPVASTTAKSITAAPGRFMGNLQYPFRSR
jgi:hypothetical protein